MPEPKTRKWIYTVPIAGGEMEAEIWTASTDRSEIKATVALTHHVAESQVKIRLAQ